MLVRVFYNKSYDRLFIHESGGGFRMEVAVTLRNARFPEGFRRGTQKRSHDLRFVAIGELVKYSAPADVIAERIHFGVNAFVRRDGSTINQAFEACINRNLIQVVEQKPFLWDILLGEPA